MPSSLSPSDDYQQQREALREAEIALKDQREQVAALRRGLPPGPELPNYVFQEGPRDLADGDAPMQDVALADLFSDGKSHLVVYHFMYGAAQQNPCPMCAMWIDGYNAVARHLAQHADVVLVARADVGDLRTVARQRGWGNLRLLSSGDNGFNGDFAMESEGGDQYPGVSVIGKEADGTLRLFYSQRAFTDTGQFRLLDLLSPVWHTLDLLPGGRGDWMPSLQYD